MYVDGSERMRKGVVILNGLQWEDGIEPRLKGGD